MENHNAIKRPILTEEQGAVLTHPHVLTTFIHLLDGKATADELARRTGFKPLETSVYLDRLMSVGLIGLSRVASMAGRNIQLMYEVVEPDVDVSSIVPQLSPSVTLDLLYNKVKVDIGSLEASQKLMDDSEIRFAQIRVKREAFESFKKMMADIDQFLHQQEISDGEECVTLLLIGYKTETTE